MFQQILVPLDGSALAEWALPCAEQVASATCWALHLVRVTEPPPDPSRMVWVPDIVGGLPTGIYDDLVAAETRQATLYLDKVREGAAAAGGCGLRT